MKPALFAATLFSLSPATLAAYSLVKEYSGQSFFQDWVFYGYYDNTTSGDVTYVNQTNATADNLAYVNSAGNAIIKVDNTSFVPYNDKRNSVRITTQDYFPVGSVFIMDATHLPYGCSVWPSFWTKGENWPEGGEIDIVEAVNQMANNQMALHTNNGCSASGSNQTGSLSNANCSVSAGCTYEETQSNSYGTGFNSAGGGVWATLFDTTGIYIWFWSRANVPSSISSANSSVDPSSFGTPSAAFPSSSCNISEFFTPQQLVLDITLCGDWAGLPQIYTETCPVQGTANASSCYLQNVINNGTSQYAEAYFEIAYIKAFNAHSTVVTPSGASSSVAPSSTGSGSGSGSGSSGGSGKSSGALGSVRLAWGAQGRAAALAAGVLGLAAWTLL